MERIKHLVHAGVQKVHLVQHDAGSDIKEKFEALFPAWPTVLATLLALIILLIVLTKFLYKPVKKMHDDRKNYIQENIDSAETQNSEAALDREKANEELIQARLEAAEIVNKAKIEADEVRMQRIAKAKDEAAKVINDAQVSIQAQQEKFEEESKKAIVDVALAAAAKVIEKEVDNKTNKKIVENYIKAQK